MAKAAKTPSQLATSWTSGMQTKAVANYKAGTQAVTVNPAQQAATPDAMAAYSQGCQNSVTSGKRAAGLAKVTLQSWQQACANKGAMNLSASAANAAPKYQAAMQKWAPIYAQASAAAAAIPHQKGNMASALARVQASLGVLMGAAGS